jgi:hypothetical protein
MMVILDPEIRLWVIIHRIVPNIIRYSELFSSDYKFNLLQKSLVLAEQTDQPEYYHVILQDLFDELVSYDMLVYC